MSDVRASITDVSVHLSHNPDVLIAVEERVLVFSLHTHSARAAVRSLVSFKTGIGEHDDKAFGGFISWGNGSMLLGHKLR